MIYIGVDPGSRWTGVAVVSEQEGKLWAETLVFDNAEWLYEPVEYLNSNFFIYDSGLLAAEDFRVRIVGHQFANGVATARLLGALEYVVHGHTDWAFALERPGDALRDLKALGIFDTLASWRTSWPDRADARWAHSLSAWRVLGIQLAKKAPRTVFALRGAFTIPEHDPRGVSPAPEGALRSPLAYFRLPRRGTQP